MTATGVAALEVCNEFRILRSAIDPGVSLDWLDAPLRVSGIDPAAYRQALVAVTGPWQLVMADATGTYPGVRVLLSEQPTIADADLARFPDAVGLVAYRRRLDPADEARYQAAGLRVATVRRHTTDSVADHVLALVLTHVRGLNGAARILPGGAGPPGGEIRGSASVSNWNAAPKPPRLADLRIGILGAGEIGAEVLARASAFGMALGYADVRQQPDLEERLGARRFDRHDLAAWADVVSVHVPAMESTRGIVDELFIDRLGPGGLLVNAARGSLVDHDALVDALHMGRLGGACLDVLPVEPLEPDDPITSCPNVTLTCHIAGGGWWGVVADLSLVAAAINQVLDGQHS
jgi:phosphoglycerate dehydrogenase-like enzyme